MNEAAPTFLKQERLHRFLRSTMRRALAQARGTEPSEAELDVVVRQEFPALNVEFGSSFLLRLAEQPAPAAPPVVDLPSDGSIECAWLTPEQRREAESALWFAKLHGIESITEALRWHAVCNRAALSAPPLRQCVDQFHLAKRGEKVTPGTLHYYRLRLNPFTAEFGDRRPATITAKDLTGYLARWPNPATRLANWETLSTFFNWMMRIRFILENPLSQAMGRPRVQKAAGLIYTPEEAAHLLRLTKLTEQVGFWALSLFAGIRKCELERIQKDPDPWRVIDLKRGLIDLSNVGWAAHRRIIKILPVLSAWLGWMKARDIPFLPTNHYEKFHITRNAVMAYRQATAPSDEEGSSGEASGGTKVYAMARRSYISYRLALTGASRARVSEDAGTTEQFVRSDFYRKVTKEEAKRYFSLKPNRV